MNDIFEQGELPLAEWWMRALRYFFGVRKLLISKKLSGIHRFRLGFHPWQINCAAVTQRVAQGFAPPVVIPQGTVRSKAGA